MHGTVRDADAEAEAAGAELVNERRLRREVGRLAEVDRLDGGAERDRLRLEGERDCEAHRVAKAGQVYALVAAAFDLLREFDGGAAASGDGGEGQGWHLHVRLLTLDS